MNLHLKTLPPEASPCGKLTLTSFFDPAFSFYTYIL